MVNLNQKTEDYPSTNRKWQNHFKAKGFIPFIYDRLLSYSLSMNRQYQDSPFNFTCLDQNQNPLIRYFFEFTEEFPYEIYIEITNKCNLNCIFCARKNMKRKEGFMSMGLYKKIIDEIARKRPFSHLHLYGIGESTIDPFIIERINYAMDKGVTNLVLFTNGKNLLKDNFYKRLVDTGIKTIGVDFDGFSKETYEKIRIGGKFEDLKKGVILLQQYIKEKDLNTRLELAYQIYEGINETEIGSFIKWANEKGYEYKLITMHQWAGLRKDIFIRRDKDKVVERTRPCCALWTGFMVLWNGDVSPCFLDADGREIMGDLNKSSIEEIWSGSLRNKRREHVNGKFTNLCAGCQEALYDNLPPCHSDLYPVILRNQNG